MVNSCNINQTKKSNDLWWQHNTSVPPILGSSIAAKPVLVVVAHVIASIVGSSTPTTTVMGLLPVITGTKATTAMPAEEIRHLSKFSLMVKMIVQNQSSYHFQGLYTFLGQKLKGLFKDCPGPYFKNSTGFPKMKARNMCRSAYMYAIVMRQTGDEDKGEFTRFISRHLHAICINTNYMYPISYGMCKS